MQLSRRSFLAYCLGSAAALGLTPRQLRALQRLVLSPDAPTVVWLQGAGCNGCSISFLNLVSPEPPTDAADALLNVINLVYHPTLMAAAGESAANAALSASDYLLVVEGGIPTAFDGAACWGWTHNGHEQTFRSIVETLGAGASQVIALGQCATFGGIPAAGSNPAGVQSASAIIGRPTINVPGCPPHPDWLVWVLARLIIGETIQLDDQSRPYDLFWKTVHQRCVYRWESEADHYGQEGMCFEGLGCKGKHTHGDCPDRQFNNGVSWCAAVGSPCIGCTDSTFPASEPLLFDD